jgi:hypothetical protein
MSRNLLHIKKLDAFKSFLDAEQIVHRPGRGVWEVMQVALANGQWACVYERIDMPEHFTTDKRIDKLVSRFIKTSREKP